MKPIKFTFKMNKGTSFVSSHSHSIKYKRIIVGRIYRNRDWEWMIQFQINQKNENCEWGWEFAGPFAKDDDAKQWVKDNAELIYEKMYDKLKEKK